MSERKIDIRDLRDGKFLWIDKQALRLISEKAGAMGITVYSWLCFYANSKDQGCFPSLSTLARHCNVSRRTIMRTSRELEEVGAIDIERKKGKTNIYKLLNIKVSDGKLSTKPTSDTDVTSDTHDTGVVTPMSPPLVTPVSPKQYISKQDITIKTGESLKNLWITEEKLPYKLPDIKVFKELEELSAELMQVINIFKFIINYKTVKGYLPHPLLLVKVSKEYKRHRRTIKNPWGWFKKAYDTKSKRYS